MGIKNPFSPEYKGRIAHADKGFSFVLKIEQDGRERGYLLKPVKSPKVLGPASVNSVRISRVLRE